MHAIKKNIKKTSIYKKIAQLKIKKDAMRWSTSDQKSYDFYSQLVSKGDLCFDIGANNGNRTKIFLKLDTRVIAVEPQEKCVKILKELYQHHGSFTLVQSVLGASEGEAEMMMSDADTLSSLSTEWVEAVRKSGRFSNFTWDKKIKVQMTTIDNLIEKYGRPAFIKIDVEGFEFEVVKGLTQPVGALSIEFTPEHLDPTFNCLDHLASIGPISLNYSMNETMMFALEDWVDSKEMVSILTGFKNNRSLFGDVYIRFI